MREQVENTVGIESEDAAELVAQLGLKAGLVRDVHESTSLVYGKTIQH